MHVRSRKPLQDTLSAIRIGKPVAECGYELAQNAEQHLRARLRLANIYPPAALAETLRIASLCSFRSTNCATSIPNEVVPARPHAGLLPAQRNLYRRAPALSGRHPGQGAGADRARAGLDRRDALRAVFSDRVRHRALRPLQQHPVPGARLGGQLGRLLLPGHHRGRSGARQPAVRALHFERAQRAARHRRRLRAPAPRRSDPVHLQQIRPHPRGAGRRW